MIRRILRRFPPAISGFGYALCHDFSFRTQFFGGGAIVAGIIWFVPDLGLPELYILLLSWMLILITELQNSAIEAALDKLHPELDTQIKRSKDLAASSVLVAGCLFLFTIAVILLS